MYKVLFSLVIGLGLTLVNPVYAYTYSSTYVPYLYVTIDNAKAESNIVIRAHRVAGDKQSDHIFTCDDQRCAFNENQHENEAEWTYFIERLNKKIPKDLLNKPKAREQFYLEEADVKHTQDITGAVKGLSFAPSEKKVDYLMVVDTKKGKVTTETVEGGDYKAGDDGLAIGEVNVSPGVIKIGIAVLVIVLIYGSFRLFPMGHH